VLLVNRERTFGFAEMGRVYCRPTPFGRPVRLYIMSTLREPKTIVCHVSALPQENHRDAHTSRRCQRARPLRRGCRRVSELTLDREERERFGTEKVAREFFEDVRMVKHDPSWWRLSYSTPEGDLVGLVMPAEPPGFLTIVYVGVVPQRRGQGYVDDLLAAGTATLLEARGRGERPLRADTDVANAPMAAAFERVGWARFATRREYVMDLSSDRA
jgi:RimJ/RimL family protein N-acetyltransferase